MFSGRAELIILLESPDDERALLFSEELGVVREVLNDEERSGPGDDSDQALEDENPRPVEAVKWHPSPEWNRSSPYHAALPPTPSMFEIAA